MEIDAAFKSIYLQIALIEVNPKLNSVLKAKVMAILRFDQKLIIDI